MRDGGRLIIRGSGTMGGGATTAGQGENNGANGTAAGTGIYLQNATVQFDPQSGETQTINDGIADSTGNGTDTGSLTKSGAGTTTLAGTNTYTGNTTVTGGLLNVNGSITSTAIINGGSLGGAGTVGGITANSGGTVAPGNSIGTLNVSGNAAFAAGSTYQVEVASDGTSDKLNVTGTTTINGGTVNVIPTGSLQSFTHGTRYTIITSNGGVTGQFSGLTAPQTSSAFLTFALAYDTTNVFLDFTFRQFNSVALTFNQRQVANGLQNLSQSGDALGLFNALLLLNAADARQAFDFLSGEVHASGAHMLLSLSRHLTGLAGERLWSFDLGGGNIANADGASAMMGLGMSANALHGRMAMARQMMPRNHHA